MAQQQIAQHTPLGLPPRPAVKPRIDPNQIPSPVQVQLKDEAVYANPEYYYGTCNIEQPLPLASTSFRALDQGNSDPRFIRSTLQAVPQDHEMIRDTGLSLGLVIQPLASQPAETPVVPVSSLIRCTRCKGYINPWCRFTSGGQRFVCNLCDFENVVDESQFCPSDLNGRRMDTEQHPELMFGSVEFEVPEEYHGGIAPSALHWLLAIDVSRMAIESGMLSAACQSVKKLLAIGLPAYTKIAIMTFDTSLHFYNIKAGQSQASMMVVSDLQDVFVPMSEGFFVDSIESRQTIEGLLDQLLSLHQHTIIPQAAFGAAAQAALQAMKTIGGKVSLMQTCLPTLGPGALKERDDPKLYGTEREKGLFAPQDKYYTQLATDYVQHGITADVWLFPPPNTYVDTATLGVLSSLTGGDTHYFPQFSPSKDGAQLEHNLIHSVTRKQGYRGALRVRCSNGLMVDDQYGNFYMSNATDIELAGVHADTTLGISLKHEGSKLSEGAPVYFQCALLYTTAEGQRRVRVHNLSLSVGGSANPVFKHADLDTSMNLLIKRTMTLSAKKSLNDLSNELDTLCVKILTAYRRYCASDASPAQLILPESFKTLPILLSSFKKSVVLRKDTSISVDTRVYNMRKMKTSSIPDTIRWLYPRCISLDAYFSQQPYLERLSYDRLNPESVYWIQSHHDIFIWIGKHAHHLVLELFGVSEREKINPQLGHALFNQDTTNRTLKELYQQSISHVAYLPSIHIIRHGIDLEVGLANTLIEDEILQQMSYVDYLCMIHKQIQLELEREKQDTAIASASYWAHRY
ncbi:Sec23/Sec24 trunk domain-containing protein [Choanephora cucurbitarum]|nr:Sec23/Sec24 trunk domain-containing protein [Choanephora cucurbitarum]